MKKCSYCSFENQDDAKFCGKCGNRFSEKQVCSNCHKEIDNQEVIYCPNCGTKLDGTKKVETVVHKSNLEKRKKILELISTSLLFGVIVLSALFIMLPFFKVSMRASSGFTSVKIGQSKSIFYFFGEILKDLESAISGKALTPVYGSMCLSILSFIAVMGILIYATTMFILHFTSKKKINLLPSAIACISIYLGLFIYIRNFLFTASQDSSLEVSLSYSIAGPGIAYLILSFILWIAAYALTILNRCISKEEISYLIIKNVSCVIMIILFIVGNIFLSKPYFTIFNINEYASKETIKVDSNAALQLGVSLNETTIIMIIHILGIFFTIALSAILYTILIHLFSFKEEKKNFSIIVSSIVCAFSIILMILAILSCNILWEALIQQLNSSQMEYDLFYKVSSGAIVPFVCYILLSVFIIVMPFIEKKYKKQIA